KVPSPLKTSVVQRSEHKTLRLDIGIPEPWSGAQSQYSCLALDRNAKQLNRLDTKESCPSVRKLSRHLVQDSTKVDTRVQTNMQIESSTPRARVSHGHDVQ